MILPRGSAFLNLFDRGWRSRLGRDWTNRSVCARSIIRNPHPRPIAYILAAYRLDDLVRWGAQQLGNDGELVDVVLAGEEGFPFQHLRKDTACAPDVDLHIVLLPCEHDLRRAVVSRRHVSRHLRVLDTREAKVADFEVAILVDEDIARLQVTVDDPC